MKKRKQTIILTVIIIIAILLIPVKLKFYKSSNQENNQDSQNSMQNTTNVYDKSTIEQVKKEINATADAEMYQIEEEYDGRKILQIRPNIQFETVLSGILKDNAPQEDEIESLLQSKPSKNGIWISNKSKENFMKILEANGINNYDINEEGYLYKKEESHNTEKIDNKINSNNLYIIDISGKCYIRDEMSGEIVEYPFEKMEPMQVLEVYKNENVTILEITENLKQKLTNQEILETVLSNME